MPEDQNAFGKPIDCFRCGICCTRYQPKLTPREVQRLARHFSLPVPEFLDRYIQVTTIGYVVRQSAKGCVFLIWEGDKTTCRIYRVRPQACRDWVASLSQPECQQGLAKQKSARDLP